MNNSYILIKKEFLEDIKSEGIYLKHQKSGARVVLLRNDDVNKAFTIAFRTPPFNHSGMPHIMEHSVLCGSKKFPVKEPFVDLLKSSLNTFLNAMTYSDKTIYPVSSCNDKDFHNLVDIYMDAVLNPNLYTNDLIMKQEGWHYELNEKGELIYNGVVYNEMKGAFSNPQEVLESISQRSLFPDNVYGFESGGIPENIPELTQEDFINFHKKYYHPSNSYIIIYGNFNDDILDFLDEEYLSKYDKIQVSSQISEQKPFKELKEVQSEYFVNDDSLLKDNTQMAFSIGLNKDISQEDKAALDIISKVLIDAQGSPIERSIIDNGIGDVVYGGFIDEMLQPVFKICVEGSEASKKDQFVDTILSTIKSVKEEGIKRKALEGIINYLEFRTREANYGGMSKGIIYAMASLSTLLYDDNAPFEFAYYDKIFTFLREKLNTTYYEDLIDKYILNNPHRSLVVLSPSTTVKEKEEKALREKLDKYQNSLSKEEIEKIIKDTERLKEYQRTPDSKEASNSIPILTKEDLDLNVLEFSNIEKSIDNVKVLYHDYQTNGIMYSSLLFNVKTIDNDLMPYVGIYAKLLGKLDTLNYSYKDLYEELQINTGGFGADFIGIRKTKDEYLSISTSNLYNKNSEALNLIKEIIINTKFDQKTRILECLKNFKSAKESLFSERGNSVASTLAQASFDELANYSEMFNGVAFYDLVCQLINDYDNQYPVLLNNLQNIQEKLISKDNLLLSVTSDSYQDFEESFNDLVNDLPVKNNNTHIYEYIPNKKHIAYLTPYNVSYVASAVSFKDLDIEYSGVFNVLEKILNTDYLWNNVRVLGGAYGCGVTININKFIAFASYRDPNVKETIETYLKVKDYIENLDLDDKELLKYIIGTIGDYDYPKSASGKGFTSLVAYLSGKTKEEMIKTKEQIINCKLEDIKELAKVFDYFNKNHVDVVIGNENKINSSKEIFDEVKKLLN